MKKIIVPIALGVAILIIIVYFAISGSSNKVTLDFTPRSVDSHKPDSIELKVYVENSVAWTPTCAQFNIKGCRIQLHQ